MAGNRLAVRYSVSLSAVQLATLDSAALGRRASASFADHRVAIAQLTGWQVDTPPRKENVWSQWLGLPIRIMQMSFRPRLVAPTKIAYGDVLSRHRCRAERGALNRC